MKFTLDGKQYKLGFSRKKKELELRRENRVKKVTSTHPYTTAVLVELRTDAEPLTVASATVGCFKGDTYSKRWGAYYALHALTTELRKSYSKELRTAVWKAYLDRNKQQLTNEDSGSGSPSDVVEADSVTPVLPALPPHETPVPLQPSEVQTTGENANGWTVH
jgi:hypothetical protein